jgi:hypothetical protein
MNMELKTASSVINYVSGFETGSADFYNACATNHTEMADVYEPLAKENKKFASRIKKAYYSSVTDALETNFSFEGLQANVVIPDAQAADSEQEMLKSCLELEDSVQQFYNQAADISKELLTDVVRVMTRLAKAREKRKSKLESTFSGF